jgi:serine protease Do
MEHKNRIKTILIALVFVGSMLGLGNGVLAVINLSHAGPAPTPLVSETPMVPANFTDLAGVVRHGVVNIQVVKKVKNVDFGFRGNPFGEQNPFGDFFAPFFEGNPPSREYKQQGVGSGFVISQDGYILRRCEKI